MHCPTAKKVRKPSDQTRAQMKIQVLPMMRSLEKDTPIKLGFQKAVLSMKG